MSRGVSQARGEGADIRAEQEFGRAIQGEPGGNILFHVNRGLLHSFTSIGERTWMSMGTPSLSRSLIWSIASPACRSNI